MYKVDLQDYCLDYGCVESLDAIARRYEQNLTIRKSMVKEGIHYVEFYGPTVEGYYIGKGEYTEEGKYEWNWFTRVEWNETDPELETEISGIELFGNNQWLSKVLEDIYYYPYETHAEVAIEKAKERLEEERKAKERYKARIGE